ncbi:hypothetical protein L6R46_27950 [Myxococcota bacterium]|nr:hypothetical protein [Myxococcota bacterium]
MSRSEANGLELVQLHRLTQRRGGFVKSRDLCIVAEGGARRHARWG